MSEETIEIQEDVKELEEGQYKHTFFEMWENILDSHLRATQAPLTLEVASGILGAYPWLKHEQLWAYRELRAGYIEEARTIFIDILGEKKEKIYKETEDDWDRHKDLYMEVIAGWNKLVVAWGNTWTAEAKEFANPVTHAAIADVSGLLLNQEYGIIEGLKTLKGFAFTDEDRDKLNELTGLIEDE